MDRSAGNSSDDGSETEAASSNDDDGPSDRRPSTRTSQRTGATVESTAWLAPEQPARLLSNGKYVRPAGPPPVDGYSWNTSRGVWVPCQRLRLEMEAQMSLQVGRRKPPKKRSIPRQPNTGTSTGPQSLSRKKKSPRSAAPAPASVDPDEYIGSDLDLDEAHQIPRAALKKPPPPPVRTTEKTDSSSAIVRLEHHSPQTNSDEEPGRESDSEERPDADVETKGHRNKDTMATAACRDDGSDTLPQQKTPVHIPSIENAFHPSSAWQEPPPAADEPELTLYERHRSARPAPTGSFACSIRALRQESRCVICLDYIRNARIVRECLHRFCEHCIEKALVQVGRRKECPICRVHIPSRRSLAPDPNFDKLIHWVLRNLVQSDDREPNDAVWSPQDAASPPSRILQHAIQHKKLSAQKEDERQLQWDATSEMAEDGVDAGSQTAPEDEDESFPSVVKVALLRFDRETKLDDLRLPFLSICSDAPVKVLKSFLRAKLIARSTHHGHKKLSTSSIEICSIWQRKPKVLTDSTTLQSVLTEMTDDYDGAYMPLYYRCKDI